MSHVVLTSVLIYKMSHLERESGSPQGLIMAESGLGSRLQNFLHAQLN